MSEKILLNSISYDIHSPFCYYSLALCYIAMDNPEKAIKYLRKFLNYKKNIDAYIQLGVCYMSNKDFVEAALAFSKGLELEINSDIYLLRANAYEELDLIESAKKDYKNYKTLNPDFKQIFEKNIEIFQTKGEIYEAKKLKKQLLKLLSI